MSETGQPGRNRHPGKKDGSAGRGKGDKSKRRGVLGNPLLWILPLILVALLGWSLLSGLRGYRAIDTSDGLTLLKDSASTIKSVTVIDGTQRVELDLTEDYVLKPKESGETEQNLGKKVQFTFTDAQSNQVNRLVQAADPPGGFDSVVPTTSCPIGKFRTSCDGSCRPRCPQLREPRSRRRCPRAWSRWHRC